MRIATLSCFLFVLAACGDDASTPVDLGVDAAIAKADLSTSVPALDCLDLEDCINACTTDACPQACADTATDVALTKYKAAVICLRETCQGGTVPDGGATGPCTYGAGTQSPADPTACKACLSAAQQPGAPCAAAVDACRQDG